MTTLHLVRHCDVENPGGLIYGRINGFGLSGLGRAQAERTARFLAERPIQALYCSPQLRAVQTARAIRQCRPDLAIRVSRRLAEVFTSYQGLKLSEVPSTINMFDNPKDPGDESLADVLGRMQRFVDWVRLRHPREEVVCVSHAAPIGILRIGIEGRPLTVTALRGIGEPQKGSVTTLVFDGDITPSIQYLPSPD